MVERVMASSAWRLTSSIARSSSVQRVAGQWWSAVAWEASATTSRRSSGGKSPWPTGPRGVLQAGETAFEKALAPEGNGVAVAVEFVSDGTVGGLVGSGGAKDDADTESKGLRCGRSTVELLET